ncbi:MAG: EMC3/TMCO1 family protein [Candidatus Hadarchaeota archaeon]
MESSRIKEFVTVLMIVVLVGTVFSAVALHNSGDEDYRELIGDLDSAVEAERLGDDPSSFLQSASESYTGLVKGENFENRGEIGDLNSRISSKLTTVSFGEELNEEEIEDLRSDVKELGGLIGFDLGYVHEYSSLIMLLFSLSLAYFAAFACKNLLDWEGFRETQERMEEWRDKLLDSVGSRKKERKLEKKKEEWTEDNTRIWKFSLKQAFVYLSIFIGGLLFLNLVYGDWIIVWVPFTWFTPNLTRSIGVTFGTLGWFGLSFFGFSFLFHSYMVPDES